MFFHAYIYPFFTYIKLNNLKLELLMNNDLHEITRIKLKGRRNLTQSDKERLKELREKLQYTSATGFIYNKAYFNFLVFLKERKNIDFEDYEKMSDEEMRKLMEEFEDLF